MPKKRQKRKKNKSLTSYLITFACLSIFIYAAYNLSGILYDYYTNHKVLNDLQEIYYQDRKDDDLTDQDHWSEKRIRSGFEDLKTMNEDVVGWITIDGTKIDYPIMQAEDNIEYLDTNYYGDKSIAGSIFMDFRNDITMNENNLILYGHRVKDGSMFQQLTKYLDEDFFESHRTFTIDTLYDRYEAEIFAVYNTMIDFNYIQTDFSSESDFNELIQGINQRSIYETDLSLAPSDQMITLSTCEYTLDPDDSRLVVHAKLTKIDG